MATKVQQQPKESHAGDGPGVKRHEFKVHGAVTAQVGQGVRPRNRQPVPVIIRPFLLQSFTQHVVVAKKCPYQHAVAREKIHQTVPQPFLVIDGAVAVRVVLLQNRARQAMVGHDSFQFLDVNEPRFVHVHGFESSVHVLGQFVVGKQHMPPKRSVGFQPHSADKRQQMYFLLRIGQEVDVGVGKGTSNVLGVKPNVDELSRQGTVLQVQFGGGGVENTARAGVLENLADVGGNGSVVVVQFKDERVGGGRWGGGGVGVGLDF